MFFLDNEKFILVSGLCFKCDFFFRFDFFFFVIDVDVDEILGENEFFDVFVIWFVIIKVEVFVDVYFDSFIFGVD